jgi:hypothetical protein
MLNNKYSSKYSIFWSNIIFTCQISHRYYILTSCSFFCNCLWKILRYRVVNFLCYLIHNHDELRCQLWYM